MKNYVNKDKEKFIENNKYKKYDKKNKE